MYLISVVMAGSSYRSGERYFFVKYELEHFKHVQIKVSMIMTKLLPDKKEILFKKRKSWARWTNVYLKNFCPQKGIGFFDKYLGKKLLRKAYSKNLLGYINSKDWSLFPYISLSRYKVCRNPGFHWPLFSRVRAESAILSLNLRIRFIENQ